MVALQRLLLKGGVVAPIGVVVIPYGVHRIGIGIDRNHLLCRHFGHGGGCHRLGVSQRGTSRCHHLLRRAVARSVYRGQREVVLVVWHQALNGNGRVRLNGERSTLHIRHVHCLTARYRQVVLKDELESEGVVVGFDEVCRKQHRRFLIRRGRPIDLHLIDFHAIPRRILR